MSPSLSVPSLSSYQGRNEYDSPFQDEERIKYNAFNVDVPDYNKLNPILDTVIDRLNALPI